MTQRTFDIPAALQTLRPGAQWIFRGDEYSGIEWLDQVQTCPTEEEINAEIAVLNAQWPISQCKKKAKKLLAESDWAALPDVNISNKAEFESYRTTIRNYMFTPVADPVWPIEPQPIWS